MSIATDLARAFATGEVKQLFTNWLASRFTIVELYTPLAALATNAVVEKTPGYAGTITDAEVVVGFAPVTTGAKLATLTVTIAGVVITTGGVFSLTSATATPAGKIYTPTAVTAQNFTALQTVGFKATAVTAFVEGDATLRVFGKLT